MRPLSKTAPTLFMQLYISLIAIVIYLEWIKQIVPKIDLISGIRGKVKISSALVFFNNANPTLEKNIFIGIFSLTG